MHKWAKSSFLSSNHFVWTSRDLSQPIHHRKRHISCATYLSWCKLVMSSLIKTHPSKFSHDRRAVSGTSPPLLGWCFARSGSPFCASAALQPRSHHDISVPGVSHSRWRPRNPMIPSAKRLMIIMFFRKIKCEIVLSRIRGVGHTTLACCVELSVKL